jgi:hypothetical protein
MPSTRDLLQRFRPAATPGAASATGVPADRADERAAELAGVFTALTATAQEADRIRREALAEAQQRRDRARVEATATLAKARLEAESVRAQAAAEARDAIASSARDSGTAAEQRAHEIEQDAERTRSRDVALVVAAVRDLALQAGRAGVEP